MNRIFELADRYISWMDDSHREDWEAEPEWIRVLTVEERDLVDCFDRHAELAAYLSRRYRLMAAPVTRGEAEPKNPAPAGEGQELGGRWATVRLTWPGGQIIKVLGVDKTDEEMMEIDKKITDLLEDRFRDTD